MDKDLHGPLNTRVEEQVYGPEIRSGAQSHPSAAKGIANPKATLIRPAIWGIEIMAKVAFVGYNDDYPTLEKEKQPQRMVSMSAF